MYHYTVLTVLLVVILHTSPGYGRAPMCASPSKPCRFRVSVGAIGGPQIDTNTVDTCTCSPPYDCSYGWNDPLRVLSRKLISTNANITMQMKFCRNVASARLCRRRDIAIELKGSTMMPLDIAAYHCRCRRRKPLVLFSSSYGEDYMTYHSYKCANHINTCSESAPCLSMDEFSTQYHCQCPEGLQCRVQGMMGYCAP